MTQHSGERAPFKSFLEWILGVNPQYASIFYRYCFLYTFYTDSWRCAGRLTWRVICQTQSMNWTKRGERSELAWFSSPCPTRFNTDKKTFTCSNDIFTSRDFVFLLFSLKITQEGVIYQTMVWKVWSFYSFLFFCIFLKCKMFQIIKKKLILQKYSIKFLHNS